MRKFTLLRLLLLPLLALFFVACGGDETTEEGGGGLAEATPGGTTEEFGAPDTGEEITDTAEITGSVEMTATAGVTETVETTATAAVETPEVTVTSTVTATEDLTEEPDEETPDLEAEETIVVEAEELIGMGIEDETGAEIGIVVEVLAGEAGGLQYVVVERLDADVETSTTLTDTTELAQTAFVAVSWDAFEVETVAGATDSEMDSETITDTGTAVVEDEDEDAITLVYVDSTSLDAQSAFDMQLLDEGDYILDTDEAETNEAADAEFDVPSEYLGLLQVSEYGDYELLNAEGDELGDVEDLLINLTDGEIAYLVVDVGGFLGIGARSVAIPWDHLLLETRPEDAEHTPFSLDVADEMLEEAPEIELDDWTPRVDPDWDLEFSEYWELDVTG